LTHRRSGSQEGLLKAQIAKFRKPYHKRYRKEDYKKSPRTCITVGFKNMAYECDYDHVK
jgi:hypothetical protein